MENERKSTSKAEVVEIKLEKIEGSDNVSLCRVFGGYNCVLNTKQWEGVSKGIYIVPDTIVKVSRPEFAWLATDAKIDGTYRIKAKKIRGIVSFGLMVPAPEDAVIGDDYWNRLELEHYEPETQTNKDGTKKIFTGGEAGKAPPIWTVVYDVEAGRRYANQMFDEGEPVVITEKLHGANSRFVFSNGVMYCGSKSEWKKEYPSYEHITKEKLLENGVPEDNIQEILDRVHNKPKQRNSWWNCLDKYPELHKFCVENPDFIVYGELIGVQDMKYGLKSGEIGFYAFDIMKDGKFLNFEDAYEKLVSYGIPYVPKIKVNHPYNFEEICQLAEGMSTVENANHIREGVVVKPMTERVHDRLGRVCLKWVGSGYLTRKEK